VGGQPYGVVVSPNHFGFVSLRNGAPLVVLNTSRFVPAVARKTRPTDSEGEALTHNHRYLLVAGGSGLTVFRVRDLEAGSPALAGSLNSPGGQFALQVVPSPNDRFAFVAMQNSGNVAVFNLDKALKHGFGPAAFVGMIPITGLPTGMAASPDGRYLYVVSRPAIPVDSGMGTLAIINLRKAEATPRSSVIKNDSAGCGSARVITSANGQQVWVTAAGGNALEAFSATKLISDPRHALDARVLVGAAPIGLVLVDNGRRMVVADSSDSSTGTDADLAVVNVSKALAHQPAVIRAIRSRGRPHQFALEPGGKTLLVTNTGSGEVQAVNVAQLP
jgi:DNA-binding beta-propeller fold protein YncE